MSPSSSESSGELLRVLVPVDRAVAESGPHRNVVSSLNALSRRDDVDLRVVCGEFDETAPFARDDRAELRLGFDPHDPVQVVPNLMSLQRAALGRDVVYVPTGLKSFLYAYSAKLLHRLPLVAGPNMTGIPWLMDTTDPSPLMTTGMSDAWITMSAERMARCIRAGTGPDQIELIPHALDLERFHPDRSDPSVLQYRGLAASNNTVLHVGRFDERRKGTGLLMETFEEIADRVDDVELGVVGPEGPLLDDEVLARPDVHFLGPIYGTELAELFASADVFLGTSTYETFWYTPLEAMASGTPVVATQVGAVPRMIREDGVHGYGVEIRDGEGRIRSDAAELLADPVVELLESEELRGEVGRKGRERVEESFSEERLGRQLVEVLSGVTAEG